MATVFGSNNAKGIPWKGPLLREGQAKAFQSSLRALAQLFSVVSIFILLMTLACLPSRPTGSDPFPGDYPSAALPELNPNMSTPPDLSPPGYRLGPDDVVNILVYTEPDLTTVSRVSQDGFIDFPLIGEIYASGLTRQELSTRIEERLLDGFLVNPDVTVMFQQYRQHMVYLMGEITVPGPYRITHGNTLLEMISKAGDFTPIAKRSKVKIIRPTDGESSVFYVDASRITDKGRLDEDVVLMPGDIIIVPERFF